MNVQRVSKVLLLSAVVLLLSAAAATAAGYARHTVKAARLTVKSTRYGKALFGPSGKVLYGFTADRNGKSHCYGDCAAAWPPLLTRGAPVAGTGVTQALLGTTTRTNGRKQVTYKGHPLYYYVGDQVGKVACQHVSEYGGLWLIVNPSGRLNTAS